MHDFDLTDEEIRAIRSLKALAKKWPATLWLYSASGTLTVMRHNEDGERAMRGDGVDDEFVVDRIEGITNDGGDW